MGNAPAGIATDQSGKACEESNTDGMTWTETVLPCRITTNRRKNRKMGLLEMVREYNELLNEKDGLKEATKKNNEAIEQKKQEIAQQMIDDDVPNISVGGYKFFLQDKTIYSKKSEEALRAAGLDFLEVLRDQGLGDIIQETVNTRILQSTVKNLVE